MKSILTAIVGWLLTVTGCVDIDGPIRLRAGKLTQAQIDAIVVKCGASPRMAQIRDGAIWIDVKDFAPQLGCVMDALHATGEVKDLVGTQSYYVS